MMVFVAVGGFAEVMDAFLGGFCGEHRGENRRGNRGVFFNEFRVKFWRAFCLGVTSTNTTSNIHPESTQKFTGSPPQNSPSICKNPRNMQSAGTSP